MRGATALGGGVVEVPTHIVTTAELSSPVTYSFTSPFDGLLDLYLLERLPLADSTDPPEGLVIFAVKTRLPDAKRVPPVRREVVSR